MNTRIIKKIHVTINIASSDRSLPYDFMYFGRLKNLILRARNMLNIIMCAINDGF